MRFALLFAALLTTACLDPVPTESAVDAGADAHVEDVSQDEGAETPVCVRPSLADDAIAVFDFRGGQTSNLAAGSAALPSMVFELNGAQLDDTGLRVSAGRTASIPAAQLGAFWELAKSRDFAIELVYEADASQPAGRSYGTVLSATRDVCAGGQNFLFAHENEVSALARTRISDTDHTQTWLRLDGAPLQRIVFGTSDDRFVVRSSLETQELGLGDGRANWGEWPLMLGGEANSDSCTETPTPFAGTIRYVAFYAASPADLSFADLLTCLN